MRTEYNIESRPAGSFWGGKYGLSMSCPVCGKPALRLKTSYVKGDRVVQYAHRVTLELDRKNEPQVDFGTPCVQTGRDH